MHDKPDPTKLANAIEQLLGSLWNDKPELRQAIAVIADWTAAIAHDRAAPNDQPRQPAAAVASPAPPTAVPPPTPVILARTPEPRPAMTTATVPLRIGDVQIHIPVSGSTAEIGKARQSAQGDDDPAIRPDADYPTMELSLDMVARRCRLKAASCDVVLRREAAGEDDQDRADARDEIDRLIAEAKALPLCFLWAPYRGSPLPPPEVLRLSARAYENLGSAVSLAHRIEQHEALRVFQERAVILLAEAQSALRVVLERTWLTRPDQDQLDAFIWLRRTTERERIYIDRYLRLDDPADPAEHERLRSDLEALSAEVGVAARKIKHVQEALSKLKYHVRKAAQAPNEEELSAVFVALNGLSKVGVNADDKRLRDAIAPLRSVLESSETLGEYAGQVARLVEKRVVADEASFEMARTYSPSVARVRDMLRGGRAVLVGGQIVAHHRERIIDALELDDLDWIEQSEHGSSAVFEAPIARPDTRLVMTLVKLAGHEHIDAVRTWCKRYQKPLVMLKAGYNPEQIAAAVLEQASDQLASTVRP